MKYFNRAGSQYASTRKVVLAAEAEITATGPVAGSVTELGDAGVVRLVLMVDDLTATGLMVALQTSHDPNEDEWYTVGNLAPGTIDENEVHRTRHGALDRFVRLNVTTLTGVTPTATITVAGEAA